MRLYETRLPGHAPLVVATRGEAVESVYYGSIAVVDAEGRRLFTVGDADFPLFTRSTLKPFQALPFVAGGGPAHFGFPDAWLALICASHSGEPRHVAAVSALLERIGCTAQQLRCGCHVPLFYSATGATPPPDLPLSPLQHNCSGKHAGFLAWCRQHGEPTEGYLEAAHPLQAGIRRSLAEMTGCGEDAFVMGIDGCSAPNYALPLARLAQMYARLARQETPALAQIFAAMSRHPEMVAGEARGDLLLMQAGRGDWVAKAGADGMQAVGVRSRGLGIAFKIADGNRKASQVVLGALVEQLDLLPRDADTPLAHWQDAEICNYAGKRTGRLLPVFDFGS